MRTRRARDIAVRPAISRHSIPEMGRPFRVNNVSSTRLGEVVEDYIMAHGSQGLSVSGELFFQPVTQESQSFSGRLSADTSWQLKLEQVADAAQQIAEDEDQVSLDLLQHAIQNYGYHLKRNLVKIRG